MAGRNDVSYMQANVGGFLAVTFLVCSSNHGGVGTYGSFLDGFAARLSSRGFSVMRGIAWGSFRFDVAAEASKFEVSKFGKMTRYVIASAFGSADQKTVTDFSATATSFALENRASVLPRGFGGSLLSVPVVVSEDFPEELKQWVTENLAKKHFAAFEFPVLLSIKNREIHYCVKTPIWGAAYYRGFREFVEDYVGF